MSTSLPPIHSKSPPPSPSAAAVHASSSSNNNSDAAVASPAVLDDGAAAALAVLRERLPPIQPPTTQPFKRRPAPSSLASSFGTKKTSELKAVHTLASKTVTDFDKDLIKLDLKTQSQARAALDALEQHHWTKLLLDHLHALTALEENVLYREAGGRENLIREEDRLFMMLFVEFEARMQRIRGREIVGIQLKKHLLAIEQEDVRKAIATEEGLAFGQVLHKEIIYRPSQAAEDNIIPPRSLVVSSSPRTHQSTNRHSSVGRSPNRSSGEVRKPAPPPARPINSARTEDRFVTNGRTMWGTQKEIRQLQSIADAAAANLPPTEQHQREQVEGSELGLRLSIERMFFEESHLAVKREAQRIIQTAEDQKEQQTAHERVAVHAVDIVMDRIIAETAGHLPEDSYKEKEREDEVAVVTSASPVHQQASQVNGHDNGLLAKPVSAKRQGSVDVVTCTPTDEELQKPSPQQPALRSRSNSLTRLTSTPVEKIEQKRLIDASVEAVEKEGTLLTPMEIITIVDEVHQKMYPCHTEEEWKTSGISTLRVASHHYDTAAPEDAEEPHPGASPRIDDEPEKPQEVVDLRSSEAAKPRRPVSAGPAPPSPPRPLLFPGLDLLCDVMLDNDSIDAFTPWKMFLSAVMEVEINDASSPSSSAAGSHDPAPFVRRLYEGHRNAMLSRDYLDNVLWRVNRMHHGVVNALELIPTRWKSYSNSKELEDEEISEVIFAEVIAREKLIQDQISEFCNVLHYSHVRRGSVNTAV